MGTKSLKTETVEAVKTLQELMIELKTIESKRDTSIVLATTESSGIIHQVIMKFVSFSGITEKGVFAQKRKTLYQNERISFKQKDGDKLNKDCTELTKSAKVVVSKVCKYILEGNAVTDKTTYGQILTATAPVKKVVSKTRKEQNKFCAGLTQNHMIKMLELFNAWKKAKDEKEKIDHAKFAGKQAHK
jgi:hypothetical protein